MPAGFFSQCCVCICWLGSICRAHTCPEAELKAEVVPPQRPYSPNQQARRKEATEYEVSQVTGTWEWSLNGKPVISLMPHHSLHL